MKAAQEWALNSRPRGEDGSEEPDGSLVSERVFVSTWVSLIVQWLLIIDLVIGLKNKAVEGEKKGT